MWIAKQLGRAVPCSLPECIVPCTHRVAPLQHVAVPKRFPWHKLSHPSSPSEHGMLVCVALAALVRNWPDGAAAAS